MAPLKLQQKKNSNGSSVNNRLTAQNGMPMALLCICFLVTTQFEFSSIATQMREKEDVIQDIQRNQKQLAQENKNLKSELENLKSLLLNSSNKGGGLMAVKNTPSPLLQQIAATSAASDGSGTTAIPTFPETIFTPHVKDLLQVIENVTLHLPEESTHPWPFHPQKFCPLGYQFYVDKPYSAPYAIECHIRDTWCALFKNLFKDSNRILPYNVSIGTSTADMIKKGTMAWGQCFGSSGPEGGFSMNNFQDAKAMVYRTSNDIGGYVHQHNKTWEDRYKIPIFRGHPRMADRYQRNPEACPSHYTVQKGAFGHRSQAVLFSLDHPDLVDARVQYAWHSCVPHNATNGMDKLFGWGKYLREETIPIPSDAYFTEYQVAVVLGGIGAAFRTPNHLAAGQAVVLQRFTYEEWFVPYMTPYVHYIPLKNDLSDMLEVLTWVRDNPAKVKQIGENGKQFYWEWLAFDKTYDHWYELLWRLSEMLNAKSSKERLKTGTHRTTWPAPIIPHRFLRKDDDEFVLEDPKINRQPYFEFDGAPTTMQECKKRLYHKEWCVDLS